MRGMQAKVPEKGTVGIIKEKRGYRKIIKIGN